MIHMRLIKSLMSSTVSSRPLNFRAWSNMRSLYKPYSMARTISTMMAKITYLNLSRFPSCSIVVPRSFTSVCFPAFKSLIYCKVIFLSLLTFNWMLHLSTSNSLIFDDGSDLRWVCKLTLKSSCDRLKFFRSLPLWLTASSSEHNFENPP